MTAELALRSDSPVTSLPMSDPTGGRLVAWAGALAAAHRIGAALCETSFCPPHFRGKPDESAVAVLFGDEIGLTPTQALRSVYVINGTPSLYARTMVALVQSKGHRVWTTEETSTKVTVCGQRRGDSHVEKVTWTLEMAQKAGYTKNAKYQQAPQDMLYARAAATICRRIAADALAGLAFAVEEIEAEDATTVTMSRDTTSTKRTARRAPLVPVPEPPLDDQPTDRVAAGAHGADESGAVSGFDPRPSAPTDPRDVPATPEQVTKLNIQLQEAGITDRDAKLAYLSGQTHRDITSSKDLTKAEAHSLIDALEQEAAAEAATDQGDDLFDEEPPA